MIEQNSEIKNKILEALEFCRQYLKEDGGDVELVDVDNNGIVFLRYLGTCKICPLAMMTLRGGIERVILNSLPMIKRVELVN